MTQITNLLAIGNERYLATYDASTYSPHKLTFPAGYRVRCLSKFREFLAIGCSRGSDITDWDQGAIFFWDGYSTTYNFFVDVPEGGVNAMLGSEGKLYVLAGYQGDLLEYIGGDGATKIKRVPKITPNKYLEVYPGALTMWQALLRIGVGLSDSTDIERGVYSWGSLNKAYADSLTYDYTLSTGSRTPTNVEVSLLFPVDQTLLVGWKDNISYGVDVIDPAADPFLTGGVEFLISDDGGVYKEKKVSVLRADFEPLVSGESVILKHKLDRADAWTSDTAEDTADETKARFSIPRGRHKEYQVAVDLATTTTTSPKVLSVNMEQDLLLEEKKV